jgi:hypothetical protein
MASLSSKIKHYCANNGVASVDFMTDVLLQDDSNGQGDKMQLDLQEKRPTVIWDHS